MSLLINETPLTFSPQLAATIGIEDAILLQVLFEVSQFQTSQPYSVSAEKLALRLSFWTPMDIQRICKSLCDKGILHLDCAPFTQVTSLVFHFGNVDETSTTLSSPQKIAATENTAVKSHLPAGANRISPLWQPDETVLAQLAQHNIPPEFAREKVSEFVRYWRDRGDISHSWNAKFHKHIIREWQRQKADTHFLQNNSQPSGMNRTWQPTADAIDILKLNGINEQFIEDAIPEFVLYWRERGDATTTWNSKFIQHVKRQWSSFTQTLKHDTEPRRMPANWQPDPEVFDILAMANINDQFARQLIAEFVLYWKESNKLNSSWNTRFLQHVKYCWANKHQLQGQKHEGQRSASVPGKGTTSSFIDTHTDRSWADGL